MTLTEEKIMDLIDHAIKAQKTALSPIYNYPVGVAILASDNSIYYGSNVEYSFGEATHGEQAALENALRDGKREFIAIAIVTNSGGSPCGMCRQRLIDYTSPDLIVISSDSEKNYSTNNLKNLIPESFCFKDVNVDVKKLWNLFGSLTKVENNVEWIS